MRRNERSYDKRPSDKNRITNVFSIRSAEESKEDSIKRAVRRKKLSKSSKKEQPFDDVKVKREKSGDTLNYNGKTCASDYRVLSRGSYEPSLEPKKQPLHNRSYDSLNDERNGRSEAILSKSFSNELRLNKRGKSEWGSSSQLRCHSSGHMSTPKVPQNSMIKGDTRRRHRIKSPPNMNSFDGRSTSPSRKNKCIEETNDKHHRMQSTNEKAIWISCSQSTRELYPIGERVHSSTDWVDTNDTIEWKRTNLSALSGSLDQVSNSESTCDEYKNSIGIPNVIHIFPESDLTRAGHKKVKDVPGRGKIEINRGRRIDKLKKKKKLEIKIVDSREEDSTIVDRYSRSDADGKIDNKYPVGDEKASEPDIECRTQFCSLPSIVRDGNTCNYIDYATRKLKEISSEISWAVDEKFGPTIGKAYSYLAANSKASNTSSERNSANVQDDIVQTHKETGSGTLGLESLMACSGHGGNKEDDLQIWHLFGASKKDIVQLHGKNSTAPRVGPIANFGVVVDGNFHQSFSREYQDNQENTDTPATGPLCGVTSFLS